MNWNSLKQWYENSWLACKPYAERLSRSLDEPLPLREKAGFVFHHYFCFTCRRFNGQVTLLEQLLPEVKKHMTSNIDTDDETLSDAAKEKIRSALQHVQN